MTNTFHLVKRESPGYDYELSIESVHDTLDGAIEAMEHLTEEAQEMPLFNESRQESGTEIVANIGGTRSTSAWITESWSGES